MEEKQILLTYGGLSIDLPDSIIALDILSNSEWESHLPPEGIIFCTKNTYVHAVKKIDPERIVIAKDIDTILSYKYASIEEPPNEETIAAICGKEILVSQRHHPKVSEAKVWLSPYHLELIEKLLGVGCSIELLDEVNNVIRKL